MMRQMQSWFEIEMEPETVYEEDGWEKTEYHLTIQNQDQKMKCSCSEKGADRIGQRKILCCKRGWRNCSGSCSYSGTGL